jgi:hypothetical protein
VAASVVDTKSIVVVEYKESLLIATVVSKTINTDGYNIDSLTGQIQRFNQDTKSLLDLRSSVEDIMDANYSRSRKEKKKTGENSIESVVHY